MRRRLALAMLAALSSGGARPAHAAELYGTVYVGAIDFPEGVTPGGSPARIRVRFGLGPAGAVVRCEPVGRGGNDALAAASCRILQERARFRPVPGRMIGEIVFEWSGDVDATAANPRGAPLPFGFVQQLSANDYPPAALRRNATGTVGYRVDVSENGVARRCEVVRSSGVPALDERTCALVMERGVYIAASDGNGGRRASSYHGRIHLRGGNE